MATYLAIIEVTALAGGTIMRAKSNCTFQICSTIDLGINKIKCAIIDGGPSMSGSSSSKIAKVHLFSFKSGFRN
ncbi:MAG: hypothetical protein ACI9O0_000534 [Paracoccaceae bacterium]|jgi:hypothetical protein